MLRFSWRYLVPISLLNVAWVMLAKNLFFAGA
jgi:NADH:ubiquinone oxidoreductase subunit H